MLAWLALAVWLAALIGAWDGLWRPDRGQALPQPDFARPLTTPFLGYALLTCGGLLGAISIPLPFFVAGGLAMVAEIERPH